MNACSSGPVVSMPGKNVVPIPSPTGSASSVSPRVVVGRLRVCAMYVFSCSLSLNYTHTFDSDRSFSSTTRNTCLRLTAQTRELCFENNI